jgi:hypothetical protein
VHGHVRRGNVAIETELKRQVVGQRRQRHVKGDDKRPSMQDEPAASRDETGPGPNHIDKGCCLVQ